MDHGLMMDHETVFPHSSYESSYEDFPHSSVGKESACNAGDLGWIPGSGRSPGEGNGNPLQYSCLENPMDRGAWWATAHGVARSWTRLNDFHTQSFLGEGDFATPYTNPSHPVINPFFMEYALRR